MQLSFIILKINLKISDWATRITCLQTALFLRIFYEIANLKKKLSKCVFVNSETCK